jgi:hypothetical protein
MPTLLALASLEELQSLAGKYEPGQWPYTPNQIAQHLDDGEILLVVTAATAAGLQLFRQDVPGARIRASANLPARWASKFRMLAYPDAQRHSPEGLTPMELLDRAEQRASLKQKRKRVTSQRRAT